MAEKISVLFVCLGNICRSTMAEGVFRDVVKKNPEYKEKIGRIDSCGTGADTLTFLLGTRGMARTDEKAA